MVKAMLRTISDRRVLGREGEADLRIGVARSVPASQGVGPLTFLALELKQPTAGVGLARLGGLAFNFGNASEGDGAGVAKCARGIKADSCALIPPS